MFEVRRNIPEPKFAGRPRVYPFDQCKAGDGFEVPEDKIASVRSALQHWKKMHGMNQIWITRQNKDGTYIVKRKV